MGGRLALHCLQENSRIWQGAVFLSTHPGLQNSKDKNERLAQDNNWVEVIEKEPWESFSRKWNEQDIFAGSNVERKKENYCQAKLVDTLRYWSLAKQDDFRPLLSSVDIPILWLVGEKDEKFKELSNDLTFTNEKSKKKIIPLATHRLLEEDDNLENELMEFLKH